MPKQKTHSGAKKRFKLTGSGKIKKQQSGMRHNLEVKSGQRRLGPHHTRGELLERPHRHADLVTLRQRFGDRADQRLHRLASVSLGQAGTFRHRRSQFCLVHN